MTWHAAGSYRIADAHHARELAHMDWAPLHAARGGVEPERIANAWPRERFLEWLCEGRAT